MALCHNCPEVNFVMCWWVDVKRIILCKLIERICIYIYVLVPCLLVNNDYICTHTYVFKYVCLCCVPNRKYNLETLFSQIIVIIFK